MTLFPNLFCLTCCLLLQQSAQSAMSVSGPYRIGGNADLAANQALYEARLTWLNDRFPSAKLTFPRPIDETVEFLREIAGHKFKVKVAFTTGTKHPDCDWYDQKRGLLYNEDRTCIWAKIDAVFSETPMPDPNPRPKKGPLPPPKKVIIPLESCDLEFIDALPGYSWRYRCPDRSEPDLMIPQVSEHPDMIFEPLSSVMSRASKFCMDGWHGVIAVGTASQEGYSVSKDTVSIEDLRARDRANAIALELRDTHHFSNVYTLSIGTHKPIETLPSLSSSVTAEQRPLLVIGIRVHPGVNADSFLDDHKALQATLAKGFHSLKLRTSKLKTDMGAIGVNPDDYTLGAALMLKQFK